MTKVPKKEVKRDKKLIKDYLDGKMSTVELIGKYKITSTRIYQILKYYNVPRRKYDRKASKRDK